MCQYGKNKIEHFAMRQLMRSASLYTLSTVILSTILCSPMLAGNYIFFNGGVTGYGTKVELKNTLNSSVNLEHIMQQGDAGYGFKLGLGHRFNFTPYYLAIELGGASSPTETGSDQTSIKSIYTESGNSTTHNLATIDEKINNPLILELKLGYFVSKRMNLYGTVGIENTKYSLNYTFKNGTDQLATSAPNNETKSYNDTLKIRKIGFGAEYNISPYVCWYMDITYALKSDQELIKTASEDIKFSVKKSTGHIGIRYFV